MGSGVEVKITAYHQGVEVEPSAPVPFSEKGLPAPGSGRMQQRRDTATPTSPLQARTTDLTGNWCGMYQQQYPPTGEWTEIYGEWTIPAFSPRSYQTADGGPYWLYQVSKPVNNLWSVQYSSELSILKAMENSGLGLAATRAAALSSRLAQAGTWTV